VVAARARPVRRCGCRGDAPIVRARPRSAPRHARSGVEPAAKKGTRSGRTNSSARRKPCGFGVLAARGDDADAPRPASLRSLYVSQSPPIGPPRVNRPDTRSLDYRAGASLREDGWPLSLPLVKPAEIFLLMALSSPPPALIGSGFLPAAAVVIRNRRSCSSPAPWAPRCNSSSSRRAIHR